MTVINQLQVKCPQCNNIGEFAVVQSINAELDPKLKEQFLENKVNIYTCSKCNFSNVIGQEILYNDMKRKFAVWYGPAGVSEETIKMRDGVSLGFASYFNYAGFIADHILEAGLIIKICEEKGAPNSIEEREVIQKVVRETVNSVMNEQHNQS